MPAFGALAPFGVLEFGATPALADALAATLRRSYGQAFDAADLHVSGSITARAIALASCRTTLRHAWAQRRPSRAVEMLPYWEELYRAPSGPHASPAVRRRQVARRMPFPRGPRVESVWNALLAELGKDLLSIQTPSVSPPPQTSPPPAYVGAWQSATQPSSSFRLAHNITTVGVTTEFEYLRLTERGDARLSVGATYCVQAENSGLAEAVTIEAVSLIGTKLLAEATFLKAHDAGASVKTHVPWWVSSQRRWWVLVTERAATDPTMRARVDGIMARLLRASSTWSIVFPTLLSYPLAQVTGLQLGVPGIGLSPLGTIMNFEVMNAP